MLGLLTLAPPIMAQGDSMPVGPPPHFVTDSGAVLDLGRVDALRKLVTLDLSNVPIEQAVSTIMDQIELGLFVRGDIVPADRRISIHATGITAASALTEVLRGTGIDVAMTPGRWFTLLKCTHVPAVAAGGDSGIITGRVVDQATGMPLAGAMVMVEARLSATTNAEGRYRLVSLPTGTHTITARYIGYTPVSAAVLVGPGTVILDLALALSAQPLEQVVVTGTLVPTEVKALPTPITIITADDIRRQNVMRMDQLFRGQVAGAHAWDRAAGDYFNTISVRGATSLSHLSIKTFIDGIEVADPEFTALIDPNSIERIELTRGPQASTMYGSDAIGGVLQIFTKKGTFGLSHPGGEVKASASLIEKNDGPGVAARLEDAVTVRGSEQHTRYQAAAYYRHDGEWTPSYHNTNWSVTASAENVNGPVTSRISALFARKAFDFPLFTDLRDSGYTFFSKPLFQTFELQTQTYGINFVYTAKPWWRHDLVLGYDRWAFGAVQTERRLTTPADTLLQVIMNQGGKMSILYHTTVSANLSPVVGATLTAGFNHYRLDGSHALSAATTTNTGTLTGPTTILRLPSTNSGYFTQAQLNLAETVFLTAGLRAERSPGFGEDVGTVVSPRLGAAYVRPVGLAAVKFRVSYGESIRAPEPSQNQALSTADFERLHNPALRPERQRGIDGGVDLSWGSRASLSATYYSQEAIDLIDLVFGAVIGDPPRQQVQLQNIGRIRNRGWEIEARYGVERLQVAGAFSVTSSRIQQLSSAYSGGYRLGDRLFAVPRHNAGLTIAYRLSSGTALRGGMTNVGSWVERDWIAFYGAVFGGAPRRPLDRDYWITYPGFAKVRVGLEQKLWRGITGTFDVENITNKQAFEPDNVAVPSPRTFTLALRASY